MYKYIIVNEDYEVTQADSEPEEDNLKEAEQGMLTIVRVNLTTKVVEEWQGAWMEVSH